MFYLAPWSCLFNKIYELNKDTIYKIINKYLSTFRVSTELYYEIRVSGIKRLELNL